MTCSKCGKSTAYVIIFQNQFGLLNLNYCGAHFAEYCKEMVAVAAKEGIPA